MESQNVVFKGTRDGIIVRISGQSDFHAVKEAIESKLSRSRDFFKNGKLYIEFCDAAFHEDRKEEIRQFISHGYGVEVHKIEPNKVKMFNGIYEGRTKFIRNTIRSGQDIEFPGNIVIIGDVNGGGQIKAGGNIIVLGTLRGVVHAGYSGNEKAVIAAFSLQPTQLRIAGIISRSPDGNTIKPICPELARIRDGYIVIEPYAPNKVKLGSERL